MKELVYPPHNGVCVVVWRVCQGLAQRMDEEGMMDETLFEMPEEEVRHGSEVGSGRPRLKRANRQQMQWQPIDLDSLLVEDHPARMIWEFVEQLDLSRLYDEIQAVEGHPGQNAIDPKILMALWLYATLEGVGSARALDRLCQEHNAYRWLCGGVSVNYHTLADFRVDHAEVLDQLLTQSVAALMGEGLVSLGRTAQDGMRVRASAGSDSFHRRRSLERHLQQAEAHVQALRAEVEADPRALSRRQRAAAERARRERASRVRRALQQLQKLEKAHSKTHKKATPGKPLRVSLTDPEARVMRMGDGGFRPAYNVQLSVDTQSGVLVGWEVTDGADRGQIVPMVEQMERRHRRPPGEHVTDAGFVTHADIDTLAKRDPPTILYAPVPKVRREAQTSYQSHGPPSAAVVAWREQMEGERAKAALKERGATSEWVNALMRNRGLYQFCVRGLRKVRSVVLWFALLHNLLQGYALRRRAGQASVVANV